MKGKCCICRAEDGSEYVKILCPRCNVFVHINCARSSGNSWLSLTIIQEITSQHKECSRPVTLV